ncbi:bifunctional protein FolD [Sulfuriferula plumbiphila]|uniref:Bifunctional protein FolD n=1 Tax=Sulfuriferula plumbiphila TaxID=171865 RepID=A0A512LCB3_9PROT|nr:bifunctional methylenetetrahydrofolate dehydrogenase/methenyltetrahydrofolate cyclohydrolase FolD [Sulfuriferula plumbiphila]BBP04766.1 bifunctional protein FolD [Sulfuriferula plumbiphila]GEP32130.1 bifunctional protein FolD [Sulfuriferula plumbiphila]
MTAQMIDGVKISTGLLGDIARDVDAFIALFGRPPGLAVVLVGDDPASSVYVRSKAQKTLDVGMRSFEHRLPATTSESALLSLISELNRMEEVDGILVQLPLPAQIDERRVLMAIDPEKDVDGFHPMNAGLLATGGEALMPCTPLGCMILARSVLGDLTGLEAVVVGRSNIVGKPMAQLLSMANATVTIAHSGTQNIAGTCRRADLLIVAVGHPEMVRGNWIKPGAVVIDVGINRLAAPELGPGKTRLVGDVTFQEAIKVVRAITPVPGGVGPMTITCLLQNTMLAAHRRSASGKQPEICFRQTLSHSHDAPFSLPS